MTRNVALVVLDTVRKDYFDEHAPRLADRADVSVPECRAASAWSTPSHASVLTGTLPHRHGVHTHNMDFTDVDRSETFLADLPDHAAVGVSANVQAGSAFGFADLFDAFTDVDPDTRFTGGLDVAAFYRECDREGGGRYLQFLREALAHDRPLRSLANGALAQADSLLKRGPTPALFDNGGAVVARDALATVERTDEPFFLFTNFMDAHVPLRDLLAFDGALHDAGPRWHSARLPKWEINLDGPDADHREPLDHYRGLYAAAVDYLDRRVDAFVGALAEATDRETTVIVTADHGENLGYPAENHLVDHKASLSEGLLHVPLCVVNPPPGVGELLDGRTEYFSHLELGTLIRACARERAPDADPFGRRALAELVGIGTTVGPLDEPGREDEFEHWDRAIRCAYDDGAKYVWDSQGNRERYAIDDAPSIQERVDADATVPAWAEAAFETGVEEYKRSVAGADAGVAGDVDDATRDRLASLGYL